ncbi:uncharacterized protein LOC141605008 [Silene latifolia]|uniref:uncharacterized protein LOC141605008 n=1 Tax=Silene latifolia TaxID=37657 RepID=UPI003D76FBFB
MEESEKVEEELMGLKLKRSVLLGKSKVGRGICTPPPTFKTFEPHFQQKTVINFDAENTDINDSNYCINVGFNSEVTARQLGANLWQILPHLNAIYKMNRNNYNNSNYNNKGFGKEENLGFGVDEKSVDDDVQDDNQPVSTGSFHRQIAASLIRHHRAVDRNGRALQPVSPASYSSSLEITPYNHAASTSSSLEYKGRMVDPSHNLKTSTELLKVLNRIWCLEEQHASNISVTKALKTDLDNARTRIKELLREKQMDRQVMDSLMKQVSEQKLNRKNIEQDRLQSGLQSVRQELQDERKLRKRSESLHRKMAREISEMKSSFSKALNELERERHARILLEDLCDEFAMGIRDYEHELRSTKYRNDKEQAQREHVLDGLILHISEAWLDERVQMKLAEQIRKDRGEMSTVVDKLRPEIETFLKARQTVDPTKSAKGSGLRRGSLESYNLNEATSAPKNADDEESIDSESNCFELNKNLGGESSNGITHTRNIDEFEENDVEERARIDIAKRNGESHVMNNGRNVTGLQARFEKHMSRRKLHDGKTQKDASHESTNQNGLGEEELLERRSKRFGNRGGKSNHLLDNLLRNNSSSFEGERIHPVSDLPEESHGLFSLAGPASPVKKWESKILSQDPEMSESSTRWSTGPRENTLKARLLEARLEGRNLQTKGSKGSA